MFIYILFYSDLQLLLTLPIIKQHGVVSGYDFIFSGREATARSPRDNHKNPQPPSLLLLQKYSGRPCEYLQINIPQGAILSE
ncbi:hypothetical protein WA026_020533 [Henosepilachna vigintioctopunctata]|uniref:Uncharacterized protein n=1 Tax=Henosepilachna vigintioctopunctata TaxID=420089 RepID=A0AAW1VIV3_9CUCU